MKKFISVILLLCAVLGALTACSGKNGDGEISQIPVNDAQLNKIASFGITYKTQRIVVYAHANNYVKYVVADYENEKRPQNAHIISIIMKKRTARQRRSLKAPPLSLTIRRGSSP